MLTYICLYLCCLVFDEVCEFWEDNSFCVVACAVVGVDISFFVVTFLCPCDDCVGDGHSVAVDYYVGSGLDCVVFDCAVHFNPF